MSEVYKSFTHGPIPLSFNSRRLMQNLRFAIMSAIERGEYSDPRNTVAFARGELAKYISQLEAKTALAASAASMVKPSLGYQLQPMPDWLFQEHHTMYRRLAALELLVAELTDPKVRKPPKRAAKRKSR